jgi:hypothetical protein
LSFRKLRVCVAALAGSAAGSVALAGDWQVIPRFEIGGQYDDNYNLTPGAGSEGEVSGAIAAFTLGLRNEGPRSTFAFIPHVESNYFPDSPEDESTDYSGALEWEWRTLRSELGLDAIFSHESIVKSELVGADDPDGGLGEPGAGDSGRVSLRTERTLLQLSPTYGLQWTERTRLELAARLMDASYEENAAGYVDFQDVSGSVGVAFKASERNTYKFRLIASRFEPGSTGAVTERMGAEVELRRKPTETMEVYLRGGARRSEFKAGAGGEATGAVGGLGASWQFPVSKLLVDLIRSVEPSSIGRVVDRDELRLRLERRLSPRLTFTSGARAIRTRSSLAQAGAVDDDDRDYATASLGLEWRVRRAVSLTGQYEFQWQSFEVDPTDATSNGVTLAIVFEPQRRGQ